MKHVFMASPDMKQHKGIMFSHFIARVMALRAARHSFVLRAHSVANANVVFLPVV